ncbi:MAG: TetR/AcrR family transcriptional regulator [Jatrophihabitantaceae bacterium]
MAEQTVTTPVGPSVRQRIVDAAYQLFTQRGIRDVGVDEIITASGVARATFYRQFRSKDDLVLEFLEQREQRWTFGAIESGAIERGSTAEERLIAIFGVFDDWFHRTDFEACSFINVLLEMGPHHPLGRASIEYLRNIRTMVEGLAEAADIDDPIEFAKSWHILMKGSIISAAEGDIEAARRAQQMGRVLIATHRRS